ncbi:MAG: phosphatidylcholine synthase [Hyphomicrobiales bacterium]
MDKLVAFAIHVLTGSGAVWALLAAIAAAHYDWTAMFLWLGVALFVDAIDGPLARRFEVATVLPRWDGGVLDFVIDYTTYVFLPGFALVQMDLLPSPLGLIAGAVVVLTGAIYFGDTRMKAPDNCFNGFPVVWNVVVFHLAVFSPPAWFSFAVVMVLAIVTFLPVKFVHPVRVERWRPLTLAVTAIWALATIAAVYWRMEPPLPVTIVLALTIAYLSFVGVALQLTGGPQRKPTA